MSSMTFDSSIFDLSVDDFKDKQTDKKESDFYKPDPKKGDGVVYESIIKFIPFYKDKNKSTIKKWNVWMTDPNTNESKSIDCPSTIGQPSIIQDVYFKLKNSESERDQTLKEKFSRRQQFFSLVQIIKDKQDPSLEGKIKIFKYGITIHNKIQAAMGGGATIANELDDDAEVELYNPFDLFKGHPFVLSVTQKNKWPNYDQCDFMKKPFSILIDSEKVTNSKENFPRIKEFLEKNSPDLLKVDFQPWDDEIEQFVKRCIKNILPPGHPITSTIIGNSTQKSKKSVVEDDEEYDDIPVAKKSSTSKKIAVIEDDEDDDMLISPPKQQSNIKSKQNIGKKIDLDELIDDEDEEDAYSGL